ncbi:hypothetical protein [Acinetobacter lwoffii]|uniref:hypothetical protein n=1 Tax=Acinetobacter lwoffii TaxID=28090 RepID=UPI003F9215CD
MGTKLRLIGSLGKAVLAGCLLSYVRSDHLYNIILTHNVEPYDLVKLVSISFENRDAAIWVHFETITAERLTMPLDFISRIEVCNYEVF